MPNIFPPLQQANDAVAAAQGKLQADTPQRYDYSAHSVLGNVGHVLGRVGNIALDVLDPRVAPMIPGTDSYKQARVAEDQAELDKASQRQEIATAESDRLANEQATREVEQPVRDSEVKKNNAQAEAAGNPSLQHIETDQGIFALNPKTGELTPLTYQGKPLSKTKAQKPDTPEQQAIDEYLKNHPGSTVRDAEHDYAVNTHIQQPPQALIFAPAPGGGFTAQGVHPGSSVAPGSVTSAGVNAETVPTAQVRNAAARADVVLQSIPDVLNDLHQHAAQLGPGMGRFNDIVSGKIGAPNPEFAGLVADLKLMGTAIALAHAQGRMSNELLTEFNSMIAAPQQDPKNIEAVLGKVQRYMEKQSRMGKPAGAAGSAATEKPADYKLVNGKLVKQ